MRFSTLTKRQAPLQHHRYTCTPTYTNSFLSLFGKSLTEPVNLCTTQHTGDLAAAQGRRACGLSPHWGTRGGLGRLWSSLVGTATLDAHPSPQGCSRPGLVPAAAAAASRRQESSSLNGLCLCHTSDEGFNLGHKRGHDNRSATRRRQGWRVPWPCSPLF